MKFGSDNYIVNAIGFQAIWWLVALYKDKFILYVLALLVLHFLFLRKNKIQELIFTFKVSLLGISMDVIHCQIGVLSFEKQNSLYPIIPIWLIVLWFAFSLTLNHSLSWIFKSNPIVFFVGGMGGATSYLAASKLGAILLPLSEAQTLLILFLSWGTFFVFVRYLKSFFFKIERIVA